MSARYSIAKQLPYFVAVADQGHFHRAAVSLNITQSALTRRIQSLEAALGAKLFNRTARGVTITLAGSILHKEAARLMAEIDAVADQIAALSRQETGRLQVTLGIPAVRDLTVTRALALYGERQSGIELRIAVARNEEIIAALKSEATDVGFVCQGPEEEEFAGFKSIFIENVNLLLAVASDHRLATKEDVVLSDLAGEFVVWPVHDRGAFRHINNLMERNGCVISSRLDAFSTEGAVDLVSAHHGITLVPESYSAPYGIVLRSISDLNVSLPLKMMWRVSNQTDELKELIDIVERLKSSI